MFNIVFPSFGIICLVKVVRVFKEPKWKNLVSGIKKDYLYYIYIYIQGDIEE